MLLLRSLPIVWKAIAILALAACMSQAARNAPEYPFPFCGCLNSASSGFPFRVGYQMKSPKPGTYCFDIRSYDFDDGRCMGKKLDKLEILTGPTCRGTKVEATLDGVPTMTAPQITEPSGTEAAVLKVVDLNILVSDVSQELCINLRGPCPTIEALNAASEGKYRVSLGHVASVSLLSEDADCCSTSAVIFPRPPPK